MDHITDMTFPVYTRYERIADAAIHALGVLFALIGGPILIGFVAAEGEAWPIVAVSIYVATLIAMFGFSAGYNLITIPAWRDWLRRLDHSAIYLKIAGTYTPFAAISIGGFAGKALLTVVWGAALIGLVLKLVYPRRFEILSIVLYLAIGWAAIVMADDVAANVEMATMVLFLVGGGLYSVGVIFHLWEKLPFQNVIWHVFVLAATAVFYSAVAVEFA